MSKQHTPAPWTPEYMGDVHGVRMSWLVKNKLSIGTRNRADEALASAAPELLEALQRIAASPADVATIMDCYGRSAIQKATSA